MRPIEKCEKKSLLLTTRVPHPRACITMCLIIQKVVWALEDLFHGCSSRSPMETLRTQDSWVVWKTKDKDWTQELHQAGFVQILSLDKDTKMSKWIHKIKGWWRRGDIKVTKCNKTVECWVKS